MGAYRFTAKLWIYPGAQAAWHFITVPQKESEAIKKKATTRRGFGSVKVKARIGKTAWETSIFPDSKSGTFLLPVKAKVRREEGIDAGDSVSVSLTVR